MEGIDLTPRVEELTAQLKAAVDIMEEARTTDTARWQAAREEQERIALELTTIKETQDREAATNVAKAQVQEFLSNIRPPSKAAAIGMGRDDRPAPRAGDFIRAISNARSNDAEDQAAGKAALAELGLLYEKAWGNDIAAKAATGLTDATGGWLIPNAIVDEIIKPAMYTNVIRRLVTSIEGVSAASIDIPLRLAAPARAAVIAWGSQKTNTDLVYNGYTATMYTLAKIHDVSNQFLRHSAGAAERDILSELAHAFALGDGYYILQGSGSSEPYGLYTALGTIPGYQTSTDFSGNSTVAGAIVKGIATAAGLLAVRGVTASAALLYPADYWGMASQGTDTAGYFFTGGQRSVEGVNPGTLMTPWGIPVYPDANLPTGKCIVGDFRALKVYYGQGYRVDSSNVANTRWDYNLTGFRGEMEMGLDARPAVYAGNFQLLTDVGG
jgi:HK97 family phage major capsid protein